MQSELDATIQEGVANIVQLLKNTEAGGGSTSSAAAREDDEDRYTASRRQQAYLQKSGEDRTAVGNSCDSCGALSRSVAVSCVLRVVGAEGGVFFVAR